MPKRKAADTSGVIQGVDATIGTGKMVVDSLASRGTAEDAASRRRLADAGYVIPADAPVQIIHCDKGRGILANGFSQVFADVDGQQCRILDYAPTQSLQPHFHNADELFVIGGGRIKVWKWRDIEALNEGAEPISAEWLSKGETLAIPAGQPHCIHGCPETGVAFHELVGNFGARTTDFVKGEAEATNPVPRASAAVRPMWALGDDAELRAVTPAVRDRFADKCVLVTGCSRGLGLGFVRHLIGAGARVIATCRGPDKAPELGAAVAFGACGSKVLPCDVSDPASVAALVAALQADGTVVDFLCNNAGISSPTHPTQVHTSILTPDSDW